MGDRRERLLPLLPPVLLLAVAVAQRVAAPALDLSPWKGGGFGMFSTTDHGPSRRVRVRGLSDRGEWDVEIPRRLASLAARAAHAPVPALLRRVGVEAGRRERARGVEVGSVRVEVSRVEYASGGLAPHERVLRRLVVDVPRDAD